ncbi:TetR/AcrR family transcriptional regulator [Hydrocarboniphaga sp.]|uniref:TetR/AcrR family transcriptional regulator n=1 Tax=Hydrocarboniphaga sp. TaxID=2033016 RepID=UPI00260E912A|nr:TetR/AcrR family transcriptional regulator [Hydrocarboniphaga sp.]
MAKKAATAGVTKAVRPASTPLAGKADQSASNKPVAAATPPAAKPAFWRIAPLARPSSAEVVNNQRQRLLLGMAQAVARKGYVGASVADVLAEVRISRRTFYELFRDKESCFLAAYDAVHEALIEALDQAQKQRTAVLAQIRAAHTAYLEFLAAEPVLSQAFFVGVRSAGPAAIRRRAEAHEQFAALHRSLHKRCRKQDPALPELPDTAYLALVGGINKIVTAQIESGGARELQQMLPVVLYLTLTIYGLPAAARAALSGDFSPFEDRPEDRQ